MYYHQQLTRVVSKMVNIVELIMKVVFINKALGITNPRIILMENIRQSCIYYTHVNNLEVYWKYMESFAEICADIDTPSFNENCSNDVMEKSRIDIDDINKCMKQEIESR
jgi:hypothetical protein